MTTRLQLTEQLDNPKTAKIYDICNKIMSVITFRANQQVNTLFNSKNFLKKEVVVTGSLICQEALVHGLEWTYFLIKI